MRARLRRPALAALALLAGGATANAATANAARPTGAARGSGRILVVGSQVAPPTLDPTVNASAAIDEVVDYNVFQHLVQLQPDGQVVPVLATAWTTSDGGRVYTFTIRKGVRFSNGDPMTPADVVFSLENVIHHPKTFPYAADLGATSARVVGADKVAVTLTAPSWSFLFDLASYAIGDVLDPRTVSRLATDPIGTGPYTVTGEVPNYSVTLGLNRYYWGTKPGVAGAEFRYFSSADAEDAALESGQIDVIDNLASPQELSTFRSNPSRYVVVSGLTNGKVQLTINNAAGPLSSRLVRQAISMAIDKKTIIDVAAAGLSVPIGTDTVPSDPYYIDLAGLYPFDPAKARQLLARAGYPNGFSTTLTLPPYYYAQLAGPVVQSELAAIGIRAKIDNVQWPLWLSQVFEAGDFDLTIIDHAEARDVANYANPSYYWHFSGARQVASQLAAANAAPTRHRWIAGVRAVLREIARDAVNDWLYVMPDLSVHLKGVVGLPDAFYTESFDLTHAQFGGSIPARLAKAGYGTR
jgi:peptide/nickel transport system substrate-binding protein